MFARLMKGVESKVSEVSGLWSRLGQENTLPFMGNLLNPEPVSGRVADEWGLSIFINHRKPKPLNTKPRNIPYRNPFTGPYLE